jgi:hypothetical protein
MVTHFLCSPNIYIEKNIKYYMKYFRIFNTAADYTAYAESEDYIAPNVSTLTNGSQVWISQEEHE